MVRKGKLCNQRGSAYLALTRPAQVCPGEVCSIVGEVGYSGFPWLKGSKSGEYLSHHALVLESSGHILTKNSLSLFKERVS